MSRQAGEIITPEAVAAYRAADYGALHVALRLPPWEYSPLHAYGPEPEAYMKDTWQKERHARAWALRCELEAALEEGN